MSANYAKYDVGDNEQLITNGTVEVAVSDGEIDAVHERRGSSWHETELSNLPDHEQKTIQNLV